jgi:hypothetical protein
MAFLEKPESFCVITVSMDGVVDSFAYPFWQDHRSLLLISTFKFNMSERCASLTGRVIINEHPACQIPEIHITSCTKTKETPLAICCISCTTHAKIEFAVSFSYLTMLLKSNG